MSLPSTGLDARREWHLAKESRMFCATVTVDWPEEPRMLHSLQRDFHSTGALVKERPITIGTALMQAQVSQPTKQHNSEYGVGEPSRSGSMTDRYQLAW
ncbi:hypothetical protein QC762_0064490 [Podospora pseudocomata]|uniref:Uncharacterized protein n=1 Tax=Podospora pseudocomata TaxID=2093779 RepID=A0ABR0GF02_9PEZI|nr:hypothetical protein QC762_0064490 [Podospora pseudocomata]